MPYPNVEPIREVILSLGFEKDTTCQLGGDVYVRKFGEADFFLYLWEETRCWDGDDTTHLEYRFDRPPVSERYSGWRHLSIRHSDGSILSIDRTKVPTYVELRAAIIDEIKTARDRSERELRAAYEKFTALDSMIWPPPS